MARPRAAHPGNQAAAEALAAAAQDSTSQPRLKQGLMRAVKSLCDCPDPIHTIDEAQRLDGIGSTIAVKIVRAVRDSHHQGASSSTSALGEATNVPRRSRRPAANTGGAFFEGASALTCPASSLADDDDVTMADAPDRWCAAETTAHRWRPILLLDAREKRKVEMESHLTQCGVDCETRPVALGDMVWIARSDDGEERVLPYCCVERKTPRDLARSIVDGRYVEQRRRLESLGLGGVYLVEGNLSDQETMSKTQLETSLVSTRVDGLAVVRTRDLNHTLTSLAALHGAVARRLARDVAAMPRAETFDAFQRRCAKVQARTVGDVFGWQLVQIPGCGPKKARAILDVYPTMRALTRAYEALRPQGDAADKLLEPLVGLAVSRAVATVIAPAAASSNL